MAWHNRIETEKYTKGLGQEQMSIITPDEDIITLAYNAISRFWSKIPKNEKDKVGLLLFATESGVDNSKSASVELFELLNLPPRCRCLEIKQACYGGTGALMLARDFVRANPEKKALVIMSDVAYYGLETAGEPTQGCGAVAVLVSNEPKIAVFNDDNVYLSQNHSDFYRPTYCDKPIYDGHLSIKCYLSMFQDALAEWKKQNENNNTNNDNFSNLIVHSPFTKMLDKCCKIAEIDVEKNENEAIKQYNKIIGNTYTASLYIGFISLLENSKQDLSNQNILLFSYGSGSVCEMFSIKVLNGYAEHLHRQQNNAMLEKRTKIDYKSYQELLRCFVERERQLNWKLQTNYANNTASQAKLVKIENGNRQYNKS